jgi:hypothetical protein
MCDIALLAARMSGTSAAIFGPGWVYENFPGKNPSVKLSVVMYALQERALVT